MTSAPAAPLRLLHLHSTFGPGGKERRSVDLVNRFGSGIEHAVVSAEPKALGAAQFVRPDITLELLRDFPALAGKLSVRRLQTIAQAMRGYDLLLSYNWGAMDAVMAHAIFARHYRLPPLVHHEDGFNADEAGGLKPTRNWYRRVALSRAAYIIVPSQRLEAIALSAWAQPVAKVRRIPNGIDTKAYGAKARADALPRVIKRQGERWMGTLAGLRPVKNLRRMVRAMVRLPPEWQLVILGEGPEREAILAEALALDIGHRVHLPGHVADPAKAIALFDIFALSSDSEQFPLSVVEAMAAGLAVVSPAVGDVAAIVSEENRRFVTGPGDEAAFGSALAALAGDEALRRRIGAANQIRARAEFDAARMVERYRDVYARALGRPAFP